MSRPVQSPAPLSVAGVVLHFAGPPASEPELEPEVDPELEPELEPEPELDAEPEAEPDPEPELDAEPAPEPEPELEPPLPEEDAELASVPELACPEENPELDPEVVGDPELPPSADDRPPLDGEPHAPMSIARAVSVEMRGITTGRPPSPDRAAPLRRRYRRPAYRVNGKRGEVLRCKDAFFGTILPRASPTNA